MSNEDKVYNGVALTPGRKAHVCIGCLNTAAAVAAAEHGDAGFTDQEVEGLAPLMDEAVEAIKAATQAIGAGFIAAGMDPMQAQVAALHTLFAGQMQVIDHIRSGSHPLAKLAYMHQMTRMFTMHAAEANVDSMAKQDFQVFVEHMDKPMPCHYAVEVADQGAKTTAEAVRKNQGGAEELRDMFKELLGRLAKVGLDEVDLAGDPNKEPEVEVKAEPVASGVIELDGDSTDDEVARKIQETIKSQGGPTIPFEELLKAVAGSKNGQGFALIKVPKQG